MEKTTVEYEAGDGTAVIAFNRPHRLNAINLDLLRDLMDALETARRDPEAAVVVLTGRGRAFCAGEDLKETAEGKSADHWRAEADRLQDTQRLFMRLGKPMIAAVSGYALGGGCEFAMGCDIRIAARDAVFGFPETGVGMTVTNAGTKLLTQIVGLGKAKELILTGDFIDADEALRIGLVNAVVPGGELLTEARAMAGRIAARSPLATRLSRIAIDQAMESSFEQILELEAAHLMICAQSGPAYVQKRLDEMKKDREAP